MNNKNKKGFTLVELIVVLAIFGMIMGVILNMIKPTQEIYNDTDATMETNLKGSALVNYLDDHLRYATNVLVLENYCGVPQVSPSGTLGSDTTTYEKCIIIDNNNLRGYSLKSYSGDDTDTVQKRMGATGCIIDVSKLSSEGLNLDNSKVAMSVDYYDNYKFDISASVTQIDDMCTLDVSIDAYQPKYEGGSYQFNKTKFKKEASVDLTNINLDAGDSYKVRGDIDFSATPAAYTTYPQASAPSGATTQQAKYYDTSDTSNTYTYIFYDNTTTSSSTQYSVKYIYSASDSDPAYAGKQIGGTSNVLKGTLLKTAPTIPSRPGYGSPSWYDDAGNLVDFTTGVVINSDMVFSAVYPSLGTPHNVTFKNLDGSTFTTNPVYDGDFAANPGPPADMDIMKQELVDWVEELTHDSISKFTVTGDVAFVPVVKNKWKVEFEVEGTIDSTYTTYVSDGGYATYAGANPVPSDATKVFDKWVVKSTSDEMSVTPITGDTIFEAQFVEKPPSSVSVQSVSAPEYNGWQSLKYKIVLLNTTPDDVYDWSLSFDIPS